MLRVFINDVIKDSVPIAMAKDKKRIWVKSNVSISKIVKYDFDDAIVCAANLVFFRKNNEWIVSCSKRTHVFSIDVNNSSEEIHEKILLLLLTQISELDGIVSGGSIGHYIADKCMSVFLSLYEEFIEANEIWNS